MEYKKINAIIRATALEMVENKLKELGVKGISVSRIKGYGEYANFFNHNWLVEYARIEIFTEQKRADEIASIIIETAHTGAKGDGIVAILPLDKLYRIRTKSEAEPGEV